MLGEYSIGAGFSSSDTSVPRISVKGGPDICITVLGGVNFVLYREFSEVEGGIGVIKAKVVNNSVTTANKKTQQIAGIFKTLQICQQYVGNWLNQPQK